MKLRRTWFLLARLLLVAGLAGCGNHQESAVEKKISDGLEPTPKTQTPVLEETITEEQAIAAIKKLGAGIQRDQNNAVVEVHLGSIEVTDAGLEHLKELTQLLVLVLENTQITDAGLEHVKVLTNLQGLDLSKTQITDAGLEHVKRLSNLRTLLLRNTEITDAGLEHLKELTWLERLSLNTTKVTDAGLEHLKGLTNLQGLHLFDTKVTDEGVKKLQQALPGCKILR